MDFEFADVKPSVLSWIVVGLMAVTFIAVAKWATAKWPVPGLTPLMAAI